MPAVDINVLARFLIEDDPDQCAAVRLFMQRCIATRQTIFVPITVALELEWVLRSNFKCHKTEVIAVLSELLSTRELTFESEAALETALTLFAEGSADFSDCVHAALAFQADHGPLWTFDKAAARIEGAALLA